jgi:hypothetical protein
MGEWVARHHSVPFTEPFAWTRIGEPYYAYSWLAQLTFYEVLRAGGPGGLHALAGAIGGAIFLTGAVCGRRFGLEPFSAAMLGALNVVISAESTPFLRPQLIMFALVPVAWGCCATIAAESRARPRIMVTLWLTSALAANIHLTYPLIAVPVALLVPDVRSRRGGISFLITVAAIVAGWACSPYATKWIDVLRLNLGGDIAHSSPVGELSPGFRVAPLVGIVLASLPLIPTRNRSTSERALLGALWLAGLFLFAVYFKGLGPWWWCALPMVALALSWVPRASSVSVERGWAALLALVIFACSITNIRLYRVLHRFEGEGLHEQLPSIKSFVAEPAAHWLVTHLRPNASGRLLTTFNYGSYLKWRVPQLSESIDSRGIFPDSALLPDLPVVRGKTYLGPWRSSQVAVVPSNYPVAKVLDADTAWRRIGTTLPVPWAPEDVGAGLWVRRAWIEAAGARDGVTGGDTFPR